MGLRSLCANRAKLGRGFAWYGLRGAELVANASTHHDMFMRMYRKKSERG
jgi:hypothetical protein